ncbi:hypothetical protein AB0940_29815 [Streptomyces sp. NPDC006656]
MATGGRAGLRWQPADLRNHCLDFGADVPGVLVTAFIDGDGPMQC